MTHKRVIVACDGTWENGLNQVDDSGYTNVLRLARSLHKYDERASVQQIVYYGSGIGTEGNLSSYAEGLTGAGLALKVEEAYSFISQNWVAGDELFFFGFSRGSYTVRMVAGIIGEIGILDKSQMEQFPTLFLALQKQGKNPLDAQIQLETSNLLAPYRISAQKQLESIQTPFIISVVGCFDTVGSTGLPEELHRRAPRVASVFGFPNLRLGEHIHRALHALALDETREDFSPTKWIQTEAGRAKGQLLKQVWFAGSHSDIGGGWTDHDLADITLAWMVASTKDLLSYDYAYLESIPDPTAAWGEQIPHNPNTGIFTYSSNQTRTPPSTRTDHSFPNNESYHPSVIKQNSLSLPVQEAIDEHPEMVDELLEFEKSVMEKWDFTPGREKRNKPVLLHEVTKGEKPHLRGMMAAAFEAVENLAVHAETPLEKVEGFIKHLHF